MFGLQFSNVSQLVWTSAITKQSAFPICIDPSVVELNGPGIALKI